MLIAAGGGGLFGLAAGWLAIRAMRSIDDYAVEVGITLALATGVYAVAQDASLSGPIAAVAAGLLVGHRTTQEAMSEQTRRYTRAFWTVVDENLNGILFLLVGLEVMTLRFNAPILLLAALAIPLIFIGRWAAMAGPSLLLGLVDKSVQPGLVAVLTWAGVRGGLCLAMALTLPISPERSIILAATYVVVIFSVVVQSLTLESVILKLGYGERLKSP